MHEAPISEAQEKNLRYLRILVTTLTVTMIVGLLTIVALLVMRFSADTRIVQVPDEIILPDGAVATAFTKGSDWYAVVTGADEILIYDGATNELRQTIKIISK